MKRKNNIRVTRRRNEVKKSVNTVVPEARVTLDSRLLCKDIIILTFKISNDLLESEENMM